MSRRLMWPVLVLGIILIVLPLALSFPSKASAGQTMLDNFHPIMQPASVRTTVNYYNNTFVPLRSVAQDGVKAAGEAPQLIAALAAQLHMTPTQVESFLGSRFPAMAQLLGGLPKLVPIFSAVPPGLAHYQPLVKTMKANVTNYSQVDSLPNFRLLTWFFVVPGILLVLLAAVGLIADRRAKPAAAGKATSKS
ncbi:MAG: hypothetical protein M1115_08785 [Actinobacteria bacterium]|nr:hypothetical protein [Actinomycetota bacterium]